MQGYESYRVENQLKQLLNYADNLNLDKRNLFDVARIYNKILNVKSTDFKESLDKSSRLLKSEDLIEYDEYINEGLFLENNNNDSFFIFPMFSGNHAFYGVLRKINYEYSYTVVNRGSRGLHGKYEEYIIQDIKLFIKFLKEVSVQNRNNTESIYQNIMSFSETKNVLKVDSGIQKVGNCLVKELEAVIKYVYSTRNMNLTKLRDKECLTLKPKWDISNLKMYGKYIKELKKEHLEEKKLFDFIYKSYIINKKIRYDKKRLPLKDIINKLFEGKDNAVEDFFRNVDMKNFEDLMDQMDELVVEKLKSKYLKLKVLYKDLRSNNTLKLHKNEEFLELSKDFTNISNQLREAYASMYFREARKSKKLFCFNEGQNLVNYSINLVKFNSKAYILRARFMEQNEEYIQFALEDCNKAIFIEPCAALNYIEKAKFLEKLGKYDEYDSVLSCALKFGEITKDICRNAIDIFEFRGELERALKWTKVAINIDNKDLQIIERERKLRSMLSNRFKVMPYEKEKNDEQKVLPTKVEGNMRRESSFRL